jgi:hypothetical protein
MTFPLILWVSGTCLISTTDLYGIGTSKIAFGKPNRSRVAGLWMKGTFPTVLGTRQYFNIFHDYVNMTETSVGA